MNIPDEHLWDIFQGVYEPGSRGSFEMAQDREPDVIDGIRVVAEWARTQALTEAEEAIRNYWDANGELIDTHNGARLAFEAIRALITEGGGQ